MNYSVLTLVAVLLGGGATAGGNMLGTNNAETKLGTAICKKLSATFARLDGDPVCINPAGGILKFYE
ncbi:MAG TPA: hypothetical protein VIU82_25180 [Bosea sp. (in: a-proteobacteria)]